MEEGRTAKGLTYRQAGVDVEAGNRSVVLIKEYARRTFRPEVLSDIGGFGGLFRLGTSSFREPVLVSGADGVGTKLKIAFMLDKHDTIGQDCVAMNVNDILVQGAEPLFFLDYLAVGRLEPERVAEIVKGVADGCFLAGCALIGGETAEMPDFYRPGEYDLAGFAVGIVDKDKIIDGSQIRSGDVVVGLASSGLHSNGYTLARRIFFDVAGFKVDQYVPELGRLLGEELLEPTRIYVRTILSLLTKTEILGLAHITGGGFIDNIPRVLPSGLAVRIRKGTWPVPPVFRLLQELGRVEEREMYRTFNMGIGMVAVVHPERVDDFLNQLRSLGEKAFVIGEVVTADGPERVLLE